MSAAALDSFVDQLRDYRLLSPEAMDDVRRRLISRFSDVRALAKNLVQRGWLTIYQINQLFQERGQDLTFGPCRILDQLGEGAISLVFKAWHVEKRCLTALKILRPECRDQTTAISQFEREVEAVCRLSHPNIVRAVDVGQMGAKQFLAMEYVEGTDLEKFVRLSGPLPVAHACDYVQQAALGLQQAYEQGLVHRDIKPANLFLCHSGNGGAPPLKLSDRAAIKILDWRLARVDHSQVESKTTSSWNQPNALVGTADFMAPEQARNPCGVDTRADIYSLGCTFYYLLTGSPPFPGNSLMQKLVQHKEAAPPAIEAVRPDLSQPIAQLLQKMMAKSAADRPRIPLAVAAALAPFCRTSRAPEIDAPPEEWGSSALPTASAPTAV